MKQSVVPILCVVLVAGAALAVAAQNPAATAQTHVAAAKAAAKEDYPGVNTMCSEPAPATGQRAAPPAPAAAAPAQRTSPPASQWYAEPAKVFDNLYYIGSKDVSAWAVTTSDGIIVIDALYEYSVEEQIVNGLKKVGLDPTKIKYVVVTHGHGDHYLGSKFLQDRGARIVLSEADWNTMMSDRTPAQIKPKKDVVATDGQKLTVGDTTLTLYVTPGHTPGTVSILVPIRDGNRRHVAAMWGGVGFNFTRTPAAFKTYSTSAKRFRDLLGSAGADVLLTNHANQDKTLEKIATLKARKPNDRHPFVIGNDGVKRFLTVVSECADAQFTWLSSSAK